MKGKVNIIGAGPGGLSAGMILANKGYDVEIFEKQNFIGGRTSIFNMGDYRFDLGPTFLMMKDVLEDVFKKTGRKVKDYIDIKEVDPLYRIVYGDGREFYPSRKPDKMISEIERLFPGNVEGYKVFMKKEKKKYDILFEALKESYIKPTDMLKKPALRSIPYIGLNKNLFDVLGKYFNEDDLKMAFTFQAKYLGMSPWDCPGGYSIISYIEHATGVHHIMGGFGEIANAMLRVIKEEGGKLHLNTEVKNLLIEDEKVIGIELSDGSKRYSDNTIINADFGYSMNNLVDDKYKKKYTREKIKKQDYSCSTYMLYLGVDKVYDVSHNNIIFSKDYKNNVYEIGNSKILSEDPSIYVQNAVVTDKSVAPQGKSTIYVLVPVPNNTSNIDWDSEKDKFREKVLDILETKGGFPDLRKHIEAQRMITPKNWEEDMNVHEGAVFNLGHNIKQMLYFRPHNKFEEFDNCYLVGGGTHPGSGLPTIFESGIITSDLLEEYNKNKPKKLQKTSML